MTKVSKSYFRGRIEDHFDDLDLDILCRKRRHAYAIYWAEDGSPLARLRPTGRDHEVEVYRWVDDRWQQAGEFGTVLPLDEALEYITDDPDDLFFQDDGSEEVVSPPRERARSHPPTADTVRRLHRYVLICALLGGVAGGACPGPVGGLASGVGGGLLFSTGLVLLTGRRRIILPRAVVFGIPLALIGGAAGTIGGSANEALSGGVWGSICGSLIAGLCSLLLLRHWSLAWLIGFSAGLMLAARLAGVLHLRDHFVGLALVALAATAAAKLYGTMVRQYSGAIRLSLSSTQDV